MGGETEHKAKYPVLTLEKAIDILRYMSENAMPQGISITELSERLNLSKNNVHRILDTLHACGLVDKHSGKQTYILGWGLYELARAVPVYHNINTTDYVSIMGELCALVSESINMGICSSSNECVILCRVDPTRTTLFTSQVGSVQPLHVTGLGKVLMSEWSDQQIRDYFRGVHIKKMTAQSINNAEELIMECGRIRAQGYAIDNEENFNGLRCVAMPVRNYTGHITAALSISGPTSRMSEGRIQGMLDSLRAACNTLSTHLGHRVKDTGHLPNR